MLALQRTVRALGRGALLTWTILGVVACTDEGYRDRLLGRDWNGGLTPPLDADDAGTEPTDAGTRRATGCVPPITSEALPARIAVMAAGSDDSASRGILTADLFGRFVDHCGSCHTGLAAQGGLNVGPANFAIRIGPEALTRLRGETPDVFMPPPPLGKPFSERADDDPLVQFAGLLEQWIDAGRPADVFYPETTAPGATDQSPYRMTPHVGEQLSNLGSCIPSPDMMMTKPERAAELDRKFEAMTSFADLPRSLRDTDVFTFDAEVLANHGVVAFAPAYTLWADNAKKIRMIRVPVGSSVRFNVTTQRFELPPNTRVYKTFLKPVTDLDGNTRYRKMETRIIVSRPDDGDTATALFGSYKWNEDETEAVLQTVPYRDGHDFADDVFTYIVDERIEDEVLGQLPTDLGAALLAAGGSRTYAIPGADRCVHCHMGSPSANFILGFTPLQLLRRAEGRGGVIEPAQRHELDQIDRLIAYGVISNLESSASIQWLEDSQGARKPRNEHELVAQGYVYGNCSHCHNPRGYPSRRAPALAPVLDFFPSGTGGIFQFPLDKVSPRTFRGDSQKVPIPYISPSLYDLPREALYTNAHQRQIAADQYSDKWISYANPNEGQFTSQTVNAEILLERGYQVPLEPGYPLYAPWRSFIYRNVDAPFSYQDGSTIFPHMPMDTPGYDCRARAVLGRWMLSIPSRWKAKPEREPKRLLEYLEMADQEPIPHEEVLPEDPEYADALALAEDRLTKFAASPRLASCPGPELDVLAPEVSSGVRTAPLGDLGGVYDEVGELLGSFSLPAIPGRPHYFKTDLRKDASWAIRRPDWYDVLVEEGADPTKPDSNPIAQAESRDALWAVSKLRLGPELKQRLLTPVPFGLWNTDGKNCDAKFESAAVRKVSAIAAEQRPAWMAYSQAANDARVYDIAPGAQVFATICSKCHGPLGDGSSALATTIADLTGGLARVANLRDGMFGPVDAPGTARAALDKFGIADGVQGLGVDEWAARYVAWMGLSGTNATIPAAALTQIGAAVVLGREREGNIMAVRDESAAANMLSAVKAACELLLPRDARLDFDIGLGDVLGQGGTRQGPDRQKTLEGRGLILKNGDADLWRMLCSLDNPAPVRVVTVLAGTPEIYNIHLADTDHYTKLFAREGYPASAPVGNGAAVVAGITPDNAWPWCVTATSDADFAAYEVSSGRSLPRCPSELFAQDSNGRPTHALSKQDANRWALRGAANAGIAVFLYLDAISRGEIERLPAYDRCEELP